MHKNIWKHCTTKLCEFIFSSNRLFILKALKWRVENNIEAVLEAEIDPFFTTNFPHKCVGADYRGNPGVHFILWITNIYNIVCIKICFVVVILVPFALFDLRKLMAVNKLDEFDFFARYLLEDWARSVRLCNEKRKPGQAPITKFTLVYDLEGFSYSQLLSFSGITYLLSIEAGNVSCKFMNFLPIFLAMRKWLKVVVRSFQFLYLIIIRFLLAYPNILFSGRLWSILSGVCFSATLRQRSELFSDFFEHAQRSTCPSNTLQSGAVPNFDWLVKSCRSSYGPSYSSRTIWRYQ